MALGPGKYDEVLSVARKQCGARAAILIVMDGENGGGFSCQAEPLWLSRLPSILRNMADQIEADFKRGIV